MAHRKTRPSRKKAKKPILGRKLTYGIIAIAIIIAVFFAYSSLRSSNPTSNGQTSSNKAALVDQLSISASTRNDTFRQECLSILSASGFDVTYYPGENVNVNFYKNLPTYDYSLLVFRVHSAAIANTANTTWVGMFTSEPYDESKYHDLLGDDQLAIAKIFAGNETYFGITPRFVQKSMFSFKNTTVIMMGCDGLKYDTMAKAFVEKGAKVYISWNGTVSVDHTDQSTIHLLKNLLYEKQFVRTAVEEIDPDPMFKGTLDYYPDNVWDYIIPNPVASLVLVSNMVFCQVLAPKGPRNH